MHKSLAFVQVRLYFSLGKTAWMGTTDERGRFAANNLAPDEYRLEVERWGSITVQLDPNSHKTTGNEIPLWGLLLRDDACAVTVMTW